MSNQNIEHQSWFPSQPMTQTRRAVPGIPIPLLPTPPAAVEAAKEVQTKIQTAKKVAATISHPPGRPSKWTLRG